jgi:hypothetical protein
MSALSIGEVSLEVADEPEVLHDAPLRAERDEDGLVQYGTLSTPDGFRGTVGVITWSSGPVEVRLLDFLAGSDPYRRLERAGHMAVRASDGRWTTLLRALKHGSKDWPTLADVSWSHLDELLGGSAAELLTRQAGAVASSYGELNPAASRYRDTPAVGCVENDARTILSAYALTRVLPIMKQFGLAVPEAFLK